MDTEIPLLENEHFKIYGSKDLIPIINELNTVLLNKKQELLTLFKMDSFLQVPIYLFPNRDLCYEFLDEIDTEKDKIIFNYNSISKRELIPYFKNTIFHKYIKILYEHNTKNPRFWLTNGLAQVFSGEKAKLETNDFNFQMFYLDKIARRDKVIPYKYFFTDKNRFVFYNNYEYDSYDISYLLVHYLKEKYPDFLSLIINEEKVSLLEETILEECILYYNRKYPVKSNFYEIKSDSELLDYMNKYMIYGWVDNDLSEHIDTLRGFKEKYRTSSIDEIITTKIGTCIEQAKLTKYWLDLMKVENKLFCLKVVGEDTEDDIKMHCIVLYHYQDFWYQIEHSAINRRGVYKFNSIEEALQYNTDFVGGNTEITELPSIPDRLSFKELNNYIETLPKYENEGLKL